MLTKFTPAPPVASTFVQASQLAAHQRSKQDQSDTNNSNTFGTQGDSHQPQLVTFNAHLVNAPTFETEYHDFASLECAMESVFVEAWKLYTKQVTDNLTTQRLQEYSTEKVATATTEDFQMDIDLETTTDRCYLQYLIKKQTLEETKNLRQELHRLKYSIK